MSLKDPLGPGTMADEVSVVLGRAQARALRGGSPVVELEHLRRELADQHPVVFNEVLASLDLTYPDVAPGEPADGEGGSDS